MSTLGTSVFLSQWQGLRRLTYDYLAILEPPHFDLKLPFVTSQTLGYQFWCMLGAQESYLKVLQFGSWQGFSSSFDYLDEITSPLVIAQMQKADLVLVELLDKVDLERRLENGQYGYEVVFQLIKHESHHHGQLINFMFCFRLPIPQSWYEGWHLSYDE